MSQTCGARQGIKGIADEPPADFLVLEPNSLRRAVSPKPVMTLNLWSCLWFLTAFPIITVIFAEL